MGERLLWTRASNNLEINVTRIIVIYGNFTEICPFGSRDGQAAHASNAKAVVIRA